MSRPHKRQRLSSPTYEDQIDELTQEDLAAFDEVAARFSQGQPISSGNKADSVKHLALNFLERLSQGEPSSSLPRPNIEEVTLTDDLDNPFTSGFSSAAKLSGFTTASVLPQTESIDRSPSPSPSTHQKYGDWFKPNYPDVSSDFGSTSFAAASSFTGFGKSSIIIPSKESLAKAKARLAAWELEDSILEGKNTSLNRASGPKENRPVLSPLANATNSTDTSFSTPIKRFGPLKLNTMSRLSAFKSPLQTNRTSNLAGPPLDLGQTTTLDSQRPLSGTPMAAARLMQHTTDVPSSFSTPIHPTRGTRNRPAKFLTPFKPNMRPGESGRLTLLQSARSSVSQKGAHLAIANNTTIARTSPREQFFSLPPQPGRKTLATSSLEPQRYDMEAFISFGIDIKVLNQITPETALHYVFHDQHDSHTSSYLGPTEALAELFRRGCGLATKPWVDNHWSLILWKLAGMVALDPHAEGIPETKRWCWSEVIRQLLYRYERELNSGIRPPFQKIANQDVPASHPMVVCVSNIVWPPAVERSLVEPHPELEVTDGWYRLKASIDLPMAKAVRKGVIMVGRKIGIVGARLSTEKKEASDILDAYNCTNLVLSSNSSNPVPWHTKLGFVRGPCISTLHKLDPDGGVIATLDCVIVKAHPLAFLEFIKTDDGKTERLGPRNEADEQRVQEQWNKRRDLEASQLQEKYDKNLCRYENYMGRLEGKAGKLLHNTEEGIDDDIESLFDNLEHPDSAAEVFSRITPPQAALLAQRIRRHIELGRQSMSEETERELLEICPPREVRSFRVLIIEDSRTFRKPANRKAQLTVWNIASLMTDEGSESGDFSVGQRYLIFNVVPSSLSAWMNRDPGSEIYLSTRRDTRWIKMKTV